MKTRNQMIEANLKYARMAATKFSLRAPQRSEAWQEAFSAASEALVKAADAWKPEGGANLATFAWPRMMRAIQRLREGNKKRWNRETQWRHSIEPGVGLGKGSSDYRDIVAERDEFRAALVPSPEDLLVRAEEDAEALERLARVGSLRREAIEAVLDGKSPGPYVRLNPNKLAEAAGVRLPASSFPEKKPSSGAERARRWYSRLSPEQRLARHRRNEARRQEAA